MRKGERLVQYILERWDETPIFLQTDAFPTFLRKYLEKMSDFEFDSIIKESEVRTG